jgi:hypothetical protein
MKKIILGLGLIGMSFTGMAQVYNCNKSLSLDGIDDYGLVEKQFFQVGH